MWDLPFQWSIQNKIVFLTEVVIRCFHSTNMKYTQNEWNWILKDARLASHLLIDQHSASAGTGKSTGMLYNRCPVSMTATVREMHHNKGVCSTCRAYHSALPTYAHLAVPPNLGLWRAHHGCIKPCHEDLLQPSRAVSDINWDVSKSFWSVHLTAVLLEITFPCVTENCLTLCGCTDASQRLCACRWGSLLKAT